MNVDGAYQMLKKSSRGVYKMKEFKVENHASSYLPEVYEWEYIWGDEFDGHELDTSKWDYRTHMMHKRHIGWEKEGISFDGNSNIVFTVFEKDGKICSTQLQTGYNFMDAPVELKEAVGDFEIGNPFVWPIGKLQKAKFMHKYGYYECRCKLQKKPGWWTAFWMQSPIQGSTLDPSFSGIENDIMESFKPGIVDPHMNHMNGCSVDYKGVSIGKGAELSLDEYHYFGMLWTEDGYTFYIDGKEDGHSNEYVSKTEQFILLTTEVNGYRRKEFTATEEGRMAVGDKFIVDHVRVFDIKK